MRRDEPNLRVSAANDFGVVEFVSEANHEAAKGLIAVKASIVRAHALERRVNGRARREGECVCHEKKWKSVFEKMGFDKWFCSDSPHASFSLTFFQHSLFFHSNTKTLLYAFCRV